MRDKVFPPVVKVLEHSSVPCVSEAREPTHQAKIEERLDLVPSSLPYLAGPSSFSVLVPMGQGAGKVGRMSMVTLAQGLVPKASPYVLGCWGPQGFVLTSHMGQVARQ